MAERIYPSAKPNPPPPAFPATKGQAYSRPAYRPPPKHQPRRRRRSRCCSCCLCLTLFLVAVIIAAAIVGGVFYVLYRPHRPSFSVSALNLTSSSSSSHLELSVTATNPNKKITFTYNPFLVSVASDGTSFGTGTFSSFVHHAKNTTVLKTVVLSSSNSSIVDLKKTTKSSVPLVIEMETKVGATVGKLKTKKVRIKIICEGLSMSVPKKKSSAAVSTPDVSCKVEMSIKIWKWTI